MIEITEQSIQIDKLLHFVSDPAAGAISTFLGTVRNHNQGKQVLYLEYDSYIPMATAKMKTIVQQARDTWELCQIALVHRIGRLEIGETSVAIAVSSAHRLESIEAMHFIIDTLKQTVPIWKKEYWEGGEIWLENCCTHSS